MRYQQPIYIQNENTGVRNKDILNVNMSSDISIFDAPLFSLSGTSKIDCNCGCTPDFNLLENGICQYIDSVSATTYGTFLTAYTGSVSTGYDQFGASFYKSELTGNLPYTLYTSGLSDTFNIAISSDTTVNSGTLWDSNGSTSNGRLNNCGIWAEAGAPNPNLPTTEWIGFSKCINLETSGVYSVGIAGDNRVRFKINGEFFYVADLTSSITFNLWRVFEITLSAGTNVIEVEGYNDGGEAAFGAEIYQADIATLTAMTTTTELEDVIVFSTKDFRYETNGNIPVEFDLGESSGYSCPSGYFLNTCTSAYTCGVLVESGCTIPIGEFHIIDSATTIPINFNFTGNVETFSINNTSFNYEIYKFNDNSDTFVLPAVYKSDYISYSAFSGTSAVTQNVPVSALTLDGQYLVKTFFQFDNQTEFANKLNKRIDTIIYRNGDAYSLYDDNLDFYFTAIKKAEKPLFLFNGSNTPPAQQLFQQVILPISGETNVVITNEYSGFFILTLNGYVLALDSDYTYTGNVVTINGGTVSGDVITVSYTTSGGKTLAGDNIDISSPITSGATDDYFTGSTYFNTTTNKYELFTTISPADNGSILVMINGVTLANGIDYYQSISTTKRIILEGELLVGDLITIVYFPVTSVINGIFFTNNVVSWSVNEPPEKNNGYFLFEASTAATFNDVYYSGITNYVAGQGIYSTDFIVSGDVGTRIYYRINNEKNFETLCGSIVDSNTYSDTIPAVIQTNSINSY